jgi:hypothetical protein
MAFSGFYAPARHGATCPSDTVIGTQSLCVFTRWSKLGVWDAAFETLASLGPSQGTCHRFHDRAGAPACGRRKRGNQNQEAFGRSRSGFSTKRIATRYEKTARAYLSMLCIAAAKFWIKTVNTA